MTIPVGSGAAATVWQNARDKVRADLWRPSASALPDDQVDRALHSAILDLEAELKWQWLETIDGSLTMPSDADNVVLGASVKRISSLAFLSGTSGYDILDMEPLSAVRQLERGTVPGDPTLYALSNGTLYFDTTVPANSVFELVYSSECPRLIEDAIASPPASLLLQEAPIIANACHYVALGYLKNETEAARHRSMYEKIRDRLIDQENQERTDSEMGGTIQPDTYHYHAANVESRNG